MDRFVVRSSGPQEPTAKKRCLDEPQSDTLKRPKFSDKDYDANKRYWMDCGPGTRHLAGHKISSASHCCIVLDFVI